MRLCVLFLVVIALAGCANHSATRTAKDSPRYVCDIKAYEAKFGESERTCVARLVAKRCNSVDACLFNCQISGAWENVGGGCDHMCNYEQKVGLPPGAEACAHGK